MSTAALAPVRARPATAHAFAEAVLGGLALPRKVLSARYFYDCRGSELFEEITGLEEYYLTRTEIALFERHGAEMARAFGPGVALVELGSGSARKTPLILRHLEAPAAYVPVDLAEDFLARSARALAAEFPHLPILPVAADFTCAFALPGAIARAPRGGFFPGSTIGNFEPRDAVYFLDRLGGVLGEGAHLLVGVDLKKDRVRLEAAYDDRRGVTAAFNLNLLARINRDLDGDFDLAAFRHRAVYDAGQGRVEMYLVSRTEQTVHVLGRTFRFRAGEHIHTENSHKYTTDEFCMLARIGGWQPRQVWIDAGALFSVHLLERRAAPSAP